MLLQTNSYIVPKEKRVEHARLLRRFRQTLMRLGCDHFEVYEQTGPNWSSGEKPGRFVQIMRFRDRKQQLAVQNAERSDPGAQALLREFCELINLPYQQQHGLFAAGFYTSFMRMPEPHQQLGDSTHQAPPEIADQNGGASDGENLMAIAESAPEDGNGSPDAALEVDAPAEADESTTAESEQVAEAEIPAEPEAQAETEAPGETNEASESRFDSETSIDPQSALHADDDADYSAPAELPPAGEPNEGEQSDNADEQAENPTSPSNS